MNVLTFDIEEWYVYEQYPKGGRSYFKPIIDNYLHKILDVLDKHETKATFFCLGIIGRKDPDVIKLIHNRGHDIGSHSDVHQFITRMTHKEFRDDCRLSKNSLEDVIGQEVNCYRAPAFTVTEDTFWALEVLNEEGFEIDSSIFPARRSYGGLKMQIDGPVEIVGMDYSIKEFPINYRSFGKNRVMYSGGGYFRFVPLGLINKWMKESSYNMAYFHIRDFDAEQKVYKSLRYFKSYYGINGAFAKFERLLESHKFISLREASRIINWSSREHVLKS